PQTSDILYQSAWRHILDSKGLPIIKPPWFRLTAYDMNKGELIWQVPVGYTPHLVEQGFTDTGASVFLKGGPAATAGDLIFMSTEDAIRAYDMEDGAELWSHDLPSMGRGKPSVYEVDGRQFVVVSASNIQRWGQSLQADFENTIPQYMAFSLPVTEP
ncbi:MAG: PQQ-binding-like beta-propeller repeat protein, partial [Rhodothermaceae bacterium]|nr:PQQ-binding-like beta-propeller repeat protein [Rhodothermaceae bacterium]